MKQQAATATRQHQYEFAWGLTIPAPSIVPPPPPEFPPPPTPTPGAVSLPPQDPDTDEPAPAPAAVSVPWDFRTSFPPPLPEAVEAGVLSPDDQDGESIQAIHQEHAAECMSLLQDMDALEAASQDGTDPRTGKRPRTEKSRKRLEQYLATAPAALLRKFNEMMDVYENAFGQEAAEAFRMVLHAWHRGTPVAATGTPAATVSEEIPMSALPSSASLAGDDEGVDALGGPALPVPRPLNEAIEQAVFGHDENGDPVIPADEEVEAITLHHADRLMDLLDQLRDADAALARASDEKREVLYRAKDRALSAYQSNLQHYAEDFGEAAARRLDGWVRHQVETDRGEVQYEPGHPWHYLERGDNHEPVPVDEIPPAAVDGSAASAKLPKDRAKRDAKLRAMKAQQRARLDADRQRYNQLVELGAAALNSFDRNIAFAGDEELAWASAVALAYNHIRQGLGRLAWIEQQIASPPAARGATPDVAPAS